MVYKRVTRKICGRFVSFFNMTSKIEKVQSKIVRTASFEIRQRFLETSPQSVFRLVSCVYFLSLDNLSSMSKFYLRQPSVKSRLM